VKAWFKGEVQAWLKKWLQQKLACIQSRVLALRNEHQLLQQESDKLLAQQQQLKLHSRQQNVQTPQQRHFEERLAHLQTREAEFLEDLRQSAETTHAVLEDAIMHLPAAAVYEACEAAAAAAEGRGDTIKQSDHAADGSLAWDVFCSLLLEADAGSVRIPNQRQQQEEGRKQQQQQGLPLGYATHEVCAITTILMCLPCLLPNLSRCRDPEEYMEFLHTAAERCNGELLGFFDALTAVLRESELGPCVVYSQGWFNMFMEVSHHGICKVQAV
jgi:hypothetical protein